MTCSICNLKGHNKRTCKNINTITHLNDYKIDHDIQLTKTSKQSSEQSDIQSVQPSKIYCVICFNTSKYITITPCNHTFCSKCIFTNITHGNFKCPLCRKPLVKPKRYFNKQNRREIRYLKYRIKELETLLCNEISV
jgi:hypothetical protein